MSVGVDMAVSTKPKTRQEHKNGFCMSIASTMKITSDEMAVMIALSNTIKKRLLLILCLSKTYKTVAELVSTLLRKIVESHQLAIVIDSTQLRKKASSKCFLSFALRSVSSLCSLRVSCQIL